MRRFAFTRVVAAVVTAAFVSFTSRAALAGPPNLFGIPLRAERNDNQPPQRVERTREPRGGQTPMRNAETPGRVNRAPAEMLQSRPLRLVPMNPGRVVGATAAVRPATAAVDKNVVSVLPLRLSNKGHGVAGAVGPATAVRGKVLPLKSGKIVGATSKTPAGTPVGTRVDRVVALGSGRSSKIVQSAVPAGSGGNGTKSNGVVGAVPASSSIVAAVPKDPIVAAMPKDPPAPEKGGAKPGNPGGNGGGSQQKPDNSANSEGYPGGSTDGAGYPNVWNFSFGPFRFSGSAPLYGAGGYGCLDDGYYSEGESYGYSGGYDAGYEYGAAQGGYGGAESNDDAGATPASPTAVPANPLPAKGRAVAIVNPPESGVTLQFLVDGELQSLESGFRMELAVSQPRITEFDRGGSFGQGRYSMDDGLARSLRSCCSRKSAIPWKTPAQKSWRRNSWNWVSTPTAVRP